jgi:hypothetical protein
MAPGPLMQNSHDESLSDIMTSTHFLCGPMIKKEATKMAVEHRLKTTRSTHLYRVLDWN